jgi:predicted ATPase/DNA-binding SARP family transcriptional activator/DNA-binding CsgD family transcriptional regulator
MHAEAASDPSRKGRSSSEGPYPVRVHLLGGFGVWVGSRTVSEGEWHLRKAKSLVKLLALTPGHRLHRERTMDLLWPESGKKAASNNLRQTLHVARRTLASDPIARSWYLGTEADSLVLCPESDLRVDVEAFEAAALSAQRSREPGAYEAAIELYIGELLPEDRYDEWTEDRRRELSETYTSLFLGLAWSCEVREDYCTAIEILRKVTREEPINEEAHAGLMRLYALSGRKAEALRHYKSFEETICLELGTGPSASTRALKKEIYSGTFPTTVAHPLVLPSKELSEPSQHNLPPPRTTFIGREGEILEVKRALTMTRLLTITGAGGSGKTRLALEVARELIGVYPDGVWLAELASLSQGKFVAQSVAEAVGVQGQPGQPLTDTLVDALRTKKMLLILDNCEHLVDAVGGVVALLLDTCPHLRILATSRDILGAVGEVIWPVSLLSAPDPKDLPTEAQLEGYESVKLFVDRARQRNPAFALRAENAQAIAQICVRLEGLPLAIELAAARIMMLPPQALLSRLKDRLKLLTGGPREFSKRQRSLRGTIEWSYELLEEGEKTLFWRLSVFSGGATLEAIEAVCDALGDLSVDALDGVSSLLDKSLLRQEEGVEGESRFVMLETIREYAQERLEKSGEAECIKRAHAEYFLALAEEAESMLWGPEEAVWLDRLEQEHDNMRAALSWGMEHDEVELALRLGGALSCFWELAGYFTEGRSWLEAALARNKWASAEARIKVLEGVCWLANWQGDLERVEATAEEGLKLSVEAELGEEVAANIQGALSEVARQRGDYERAAALGKVSLTLNRQAKNTVGEAWSLMNLASVLDDRGDYERAKQLYEEGMALCRQLGSAFLLDGYLINLGYMSLHEGDLERATELNEEAADRFRKEGRGSGLNIILNNLGWAALLRGEYDKARTLYKDSLILCKESGDRIGTSESLEGLAGSAGAKGVPDRAARLFGAAEALREAIGCQQAPADSTLRDQFLQAARSRLAEVAWEKAFIEGRAMSMGEAVEYALSEEEETNPSTTPAREEPSASLAHVALTRREREVANLVERRLTSRQIALELHISEHTVDRHVANILRKFDIHSREQVGANMAKQLAYAFEGGSQERTLRSVIGLRGS